MNLGAPALREMLSALGSVRRKLMRRAHSRRWADDLAHDRLWEQRARLIGALVPAGSHVVEFGAGMGWLRQHLDPACAYTPSDLVARERDTWLLDLEMRPLPVVWPVRCDVAVFAGVLEYLADVPEVVAWVARHTSTCIVSYECAPGLRGVAGWRDRFRRATVGWVNSYPQERLVGIFRNHGFTCAARTIWHTPDGDEPIFVFRRLSGMP